MTEREVLEKREEETRRELEELRKTVGKTAAPGPVGYQGKVPAYTPSTIPGLGPISNTGLAPQSSNENEMNRLRRENATLKFQVKDLKTKVMTRIDALAEELKSLNSKTTEHDLQVQYLVAERDQLKMEVDALRNGEEVGDGHEEIDLDMDFS